MLGFFESIRQHCAPIPRSGGIDRHKRKYWCWWDHISGKPNWAAMLSGPWIFQSQLVMSGFRCIIHAGNICHSFLLRGVWPRWISVVSLGPTMRWEDFYQSLLLCTRPRSKPRRWYKSKMRIYLILVYRLSLVSKAKDSGHAIEWFMCFEATLNFRQGFCGLHKLRNMFFRLARMSSPLF